VITMTAALARYKDLCLDAHDAGVALAFWAPLLGLVPERQDNGDGVMRGDLREETVWVNQVAEPKTEWNRVHLDLVGDLGPYLAAGATVALAPDEERSWTVLRDPEGNEFCVFPSRPDEPTALVVASADPSRLAAWWGMVLDTEPIPANGGARRWLGNVDGLPWDVWKFVGEGAPKAVKNRWHWDVTTPDVGDLIGAGATLLRAPDEDVSWHVLADPEGNEFCAFPEE
jgi:hypothetical protein